MKTHDVVGILRSAINRVKEGMTFVDVVVAMVSLACWRPRKLVQTVEFML